MSYDPRVTVTPAGWKQISKPKSPEKQSAWSITIQTNLRAGNYDEDTVERFKNALAQAITNVYTSKFMMIKEGVLGFNTNAKKDYDSLDYRIGVELGPENGSIHAQTAICIIHHTNLRLNSKKLQAVIKKQFEEIAGVPIKKIWAHYVLIPAKEWHSTAFHAAKLKSYVHKNDPEYSNLTDHDVLAEQLADIDRNTQLIPDESSRDSSSSYSGVKTLFNFDEDEERDLSMPHATFDEDSNTFYSDEEEEEDLDDRLPPRKVEELRRAAQTEAVAEARGVTDNLDRFRNAPKSKSNPIPIPKAKEGPVDRTAVPFRQLEPLAFGAPAAKSKKPRTQ